MGWLVHLLNWVRFEISRVGILVMAADALVIQASVAWGGWGLERGWGEVVEGEGRDFGRGR
jgi:hypothetical protein